MRKYVNRWKTITCRQLTHGQRPNRKPTHRILDNQATVDIFQNTDLVSNICTQHHLTKIHCNAGTCSTNLIADLKGYGTVWFDCKGMANILSLSCIKQIGHITFDSKNGNCFMIIKKDNQPGHLRTLLVDCISWTQMTGTTANKGQTKQCTIC